MATFRAQLSNATGTPTGGILSQLAAKLGGTVVKNGAIESFTMSCCVTVVVFPQASVAVHFLSSA